MLTNMCILLRRRGVKMAKKQAQTEDLDLEVEGLEDLDFGDVAVDERDEEAEDWSVDEEDEEPQAPQPEKAEAAAPKTRGRQTKGGEEPEAEEPAPKTEAKAESAATTTVVLADQQQAADTSAEVPAPLLVEAINHRIRVLRERGQDTSQLEWVLSLLSVLQVRWRGGSYVSRRQKGTPDSDLKTKGTPSLI